MVALDAARQAARAAHESIYYTGLCTIIEYTSVTDPNTKRTTQQETTVLEGQPCCLSFESTSAASQTDTVTEIAQGIKLFLAPEVAVKAGSKIIVEQDGVTTAYSASGLPAVYPGHQEIMLELFRGWA